MTSCDRFRISQLFLKHLYLSFQCLDLHLVCLLVLRCLVILRTQPRTRSVLSPLQTYLERGLRCFDIAC